MHESPGDGDRSQTAEPQEELHPPTQAETMGALLDAHEPEHSSLRRGDVVDATVVSVGRDEILVDIGAKSEAVIPTTEIPRGELDQLQVGSQVVAYVLQPEDREGHSVLSMSRAQAERGWRRLQKAAEDGEMVEGTVVEFNKGGLIVSVEGARGFVPLSQIGDFRRGAKEEDLDEKLRVYVGRHLYLKVIEINRRRNRLILSERAAMQQRRAVEKDRLLQELQPGEVRHGVVSSLCDFGAFVDLGGADGLVHLSELTWTPLGHPRELVHVGQEVDVYVVSVDQEKKKIALSMKRLTPEPWTRVAEQYHVGDFVHGRITKLAPFGAFARLDEGVEGLIHISELSDERITHPKQVVRESDQVQLRVLRIDTERRRLGLSLRQGGFVLENVEEAQPEADGTEVAYTSGTEADEAVRAQAEPAGTESPAEEAQAEPSEAEGTAAEQVVPEQEQEASVEPEPQSEQAQAASAEVEAEETVQSEPADRDQEEVAAEGSDTPEPAVQTKPEDRVQDGERPEAEQEAEQPEASEWEAQGTRKA